MKDEEKKREGEYDPKYGIWIDPDGTARVPMNGFPVPQFLDWNAHCVIRHKNCRWEKVVSDHEKARAYEILLCQLAEGQVPTLVQTTEGQVVEEKDSEEVKPVKLFR